MLETSSIHSKALPQQGWIGLTAIITAIQAILSLMCRVLPLFGLPLTIVAGVSPAAAGQLAAMTSFGSMVFFLWGPVLLSGVSSHRQLQLGCFVSAIAMIFCFGTAWHWQLIASFLIGLGFGPSVPAASDIMMRLAPPAKRALVFSIKQAGVPAGGLAAGLCLPVIAIWGGIGLAFTAAACLALIGSFSLWLWPIRMDADSHQSPPRGLRVSGLSHLVVGSRHELPAFLIGHFGKKAPCSAVIMTSPENA